MKKHLFDVKENAGGGFDIYDFKREMRAQYGELFAEYFTAAVKASAGEWLSNASRFAKLVAWCDKEIRRTGGIINVFSPADKTADYTNENFKLWREQVHYLAELLYFHDLLIDERTTNEQRQNIEYTICKLYGIHYSQDLEDYV